MAKNKAYYEEVNMKNQLHLREILDELPPYCKQFFIGIEPTTASRTRLAYAYDLNCFFEFLHENNPICKKMKIKEKEKTKMNKVIIKGRLTKEARVSYSQASLFRAPDGTRFWLF